MTIQRIGSTAGLEDIFGVKVLPIISLVVVHNGIVSTCGVTAEPAGDVKVQTKKVLASIDGLLAKAGTDKSKLLTANVWLADMKDFEDHNSVWNEWVDRQNPPVASASLMRTLANEFAAHGITVNNICPGFTRTDRLDDLAGMMAARTGTSPEEVFAGWKKPQKARKREKEHRRRTNGGANEGRRTGRKGRAPNTAVRGSGACCRAAFARR